MGERDHGPAVDYLRLGCRLTIVGGGREAWSVWRRAARERLWARGACQPWSSGPSTSPLGADLRSTLITAVALLTACGSSGSQVRERQAYWERIVRSEVPVGTDREAALRWAAGKSINLTPSTEKHALIGALEYVAVNDWVCKGWSISLELTLDASDVVSSEAVKTLGNCL